MLDQLRLNEIKGPAKQLDRTSTKEVAYKDDSDVYLRIVNDLLESERKYVAQMETLEVNSIILHPLH